MISNVFHTISLLVAYSRSSVLEMEAMWQYWGAGLVFHLPAQEQSRYDRWGEIGSQPELPSCYDSAVQHSTAQNSTSLRVASILSLGSEQSSKTGNIHNWSWECVCALTYHVRTVTRIARRVSKINQSINQSNKFQQVSYLFILLRHTLLRFETNPLSLRPTSAKTFVVHTHVVRAPSLSFTLLRYLGSSSTLDWWDKAVRKKLEELMGWCL